MALAVLSSLQRAPAPTNSFIYRDTSPAESIALPPCPHPHPAMSTRLVARTLPASPRTLLASAAPRPSSSRILVGAQARWSSEVAAKARKEKFLHDFSMAGKVRFVLSPTPCVRGSCAVSQVALVTGGARGLGNEFCRAFVRSGCTSLAIVDLKEDEASESAEALIREACRADSPSLARRAQC